MQDAAFDHLVTRITGGETPRVWSLLVTVFGEIAQAEGARIGGAVLGRLTGLIGIRPEATRVALHRLRKDGWIDSHRTGRSSDHELTDWGRRQSAAATPRIYAAGPVAGEAWLVLTDPATATAPAGPDVQLAGGIRIAAAPPRDPQAFAAPLPPFTPLPGWITIRICPPDLAAQSATLADRLAAADRAVPGPDQLDSLQIAVLRVLIVHSWRRIVLKAPDLPDHVFPPAWRGAECRARVTDLLARLPRQTPADLAGLAA